MQLIKPHNAIHVYSRKISKGISQTNCDTTHPVCNPKSCHTCGLHIVPVRYRHLYKDVSTREKNTLDKGQTSKKRLDVSNEVPMSRLLMQDTRAINSEGNRSASNSSLAVSSKKPTKPIETEYKPPKSIWGMKIPRLSKSESVHEPPKQGSERQYAIRRDKPQKSIWNISSCGLKIPKMEKSEQINIPSKVRHKSGKHHAFLTT